MSEYLASVIHDQDVLSVLQQILQGARLILGNQFIGMYVHGSLAAGDFDPERSDIDFLVVTDGDLSGSTYDAVKFMHERISAHNSKWAANVEGSYIPLSALRQHDPGHSVHPALRSNGSFGEDHHGSEWIIQRYVTREYGITLYGPDPRTLIKCISPIALRQAVVDLLREWWYPQLHDSFRLRDSEYQAYSVLTMCRVLYTLRYGTVVSKPVAGRWAANVLEERWKRLIGKAMYWRKGIKLQEFDEALSFIRFVSDYVDKLEQCYDDES